jgi:N-acetylglutamate synthase-like GNAT family acetyltransferase
MLQFKPVPGELLVAFMKQESKYFETVKSQNGFILEVDGEIIGGCAYDILEETMGYIHYVYVKPAHRRQRYGDGLIRAVLNSMDLKGVTSVACSSQSTELESKLYAFERFELTGEQYRLSSINEFFKRPCHSEGE